MRTAAKVVESTPASQVAATSRKARTARSTSPGGTTNTEVANHRAPATSASAPRVPTTTLRAMVAWTTRVASRRSRRPSASATYFTAAQPNASKRTSGATTAWTSASKPHCDIPRSRV